VGNEHFKFHMVSNQIKSNLLMPKGQFATNNANIETITDILVEICWINFYRYIF